MTGHSLHKAARRKQSPFQGRGGREDDADLVTLPVHGETSRARTSCHVRKSHDAAAGASLEPAQSHRPAAGSPLLP